MPEISLSLTFLNDNNLLASSFEDNTIRFANINEASLNSITFNNSKILRGHKHFIKVITALNKTILASGSCDNTIILWDILTFTQVNNLTGHTGCVNALISIPYGDSSSLLISGSSDTKIKVWESSGKQLTSIAFENQSPVNALAYGVLDNFAYIASASDEKIVKIWSQTDLAVENVTIKEIKGINFLTVLNKTQIVTVNSSNEITVWESASKPIVYFQSETPINAIKALPNGNLAISTNKSVDIYDMSYLNFTLIQRLSHSYEIDLMDVSDKTLITAGKSDENNTEITKWNLETNENEPNALLLNETIILLTILLDENIAALTSSNKFYIFDTKSKIELNEMKFDSLIELKKNAKLVFGSSFSSNESIKIWDLKSKSFIKSLNTKYPVTSLIEFKEYFISSHQDKSITVWQIDTFVIKAEIKSKHENKIEFSFDNLNLISYSKDRFIKWKLSPKLKIDSRPDLTENIRHPITTLLFFSNKKLLAGSMDSVIHVWNEKFKYLNGLEGHEKQITCLINLNNYLFASASEDSRINLWSEDNLIPNTLSRSHNSKINSLVYNSNLNMITSGSMDGQIIIWRNTTKLTFKEELTNGHSRQIENLIFLNDITIASASDDSTILIWEKSKIKFNLTEHTENINALTKLENGNLASCSKDKTIRIWNRNDNFKLISTLYGHLRSVICIKSIDMERLVSGSCDKKIIVWDVTTSYILKEIYDAHSDCINTLAVYEGYLLSGSNDNTVKIWDKTNFELVIDKTLYQLDSVKTIAYTPEISYFIAVNTGNNLNIYKKDSNLVSNLVEHKEGVGALAVINLNGNIVSGSNDKTIIVWSSITFNLIATLKDHTDAVTSLAIIPSNGNIVSGSADKSIIIWNSNNYTKIATLGGHTDSVKSLAIIPSNENIVSGSADKTIIIWNSNNYTKIKTLHTNAMTSLAIIPSNENIVSGSADKTIIIWNSTEYTIIATLEGHTDAVTSLAIIPSNENIVSGSADKTIKVWNSTTFQLIATLKEHTDAVTSLAILPLNENIVSGSKDKSIKVRSSTTFKLLASFAEHTESVNAIAVSSLNSSHIFSGSSGN